MHKVELRLYCLVCTQGTGLAMTELDFKVLLYMLLCPLEISVINGATNGTYAIGIG